MSSEEQQKVMNVMMRLENRWAVEPTAMAEVLGILLRGVLEAQAAAGRAFDQASRPGSGRYQ